ncbi:MAG: hypothetical protein NW207_09020 [Cytophagales bacterium]|nr:hypothetical protein [Cytophagales bacterium]
MIEKPQIKSTYYIEGLEFYIINTLLVTLFLFYIDEGYYNFKWMKNPLTWIGYFIYCLAIFSGQLLASDLLLKKYSGLAKILASIIIGTFLGIGLLYAPFIKISI